MTHAILFASAFVTVFLLGIQQQNVIGRHYLAAVVTSLGIGAELKASYYQQASRNLAMATHGTVDMFDCHATEMAES